MKRILIALMLISVASISIFAATSPSGGSGFFAGTKAQMDSVFSGMSDGDIGCNDDLIVNDDLTVNGDATITGAVTQTGVVTYTAQPIFNGGISVSDDGINYAGIAGGTLYTVYLSTNLADTQEYNISTVDGKECAIDVYAVGHASGGSASMKTDGTITLIDHTNMNTSDNNDTTLNLFDAGTTMTVENQLGATYTIIVRIIYVN